MNLGILTLLLILLTGASGLQAQQPDTPSSTTKIGAKAIDESAVENYESKFTVILVVP